MNNLRLLDWAGYAQRLKMFEDVGAFRPETIHPIDPIYRPDGTRWTQPARRTR